MTFSVNGLLIQPAVKRIDCWSSQEIALDLNYDWVCTRPPLPPPAPQTPRPQTGTAPSIDILADVPGTYTCSVTITPGSTDPCPTPGPITPAPKSKTLTFSATLVANPTKIPATTAWPGMPLDISRSTLTVTWLPTECEGTLQIVELAPLDGYNPPSEGFLTRQSASTWYYTAFDEPQAEHCPKDVTVRIGAFQGDTELSRVSVNVWTIHRYWTQGTTANYPNDYNYLVWKYAPILSTTGGAFSGPPTIGPGDDVYCGIWPFGVNAYACTTFNPINGTYTVEFGISTFVGTENQAASIIGHELTHTTGTNECQAYAWELVNDNATGVIPCDMSYYDEIVQEVECRCSSNCP